MKNILSKWSKFGVNFFYKDINFAVLAVIFCLTTEVISSPYRASVEWTDSQGLCWICDPNGPCRLCDSSLPVRVRNPGPFDSKCPVPTCTSDQVNLLFPVANDPRMFWQCDVNGRGRASQVDCDCGTYFNWASQSCEFPWEVQEMCDQTIARAPIPPPRPCIPDSLPGIPGIPNLSFDEACIRPRCNDPAHLETLFPVATDPRMFWQCAGVEGEVVPVMMDCQCNTYFSFASQRCELPNIVTKFCPSSPVPPPPPRECTGNEGDVTTEQDPGNQPCSCVPCIPLWPCNCSCNNQSNCGNGGSTNCRSF